MAKYGAEAAKGTTSVRSVLVVNNTTTVRKFKVLEYMVGCTTTPADAVFTHQLARTSTDPTGNAVTLRPLDPDDAAADPAAFDGVTVDGTIGNILLAYGLHQRATLRWVANPGSELIATGTDNNGIGGILAAASTSDFGASMVVDA